MERIGFTIPPDFQLDSQSGAGVPHASIHPAPSDGVFPVDGAAGVDHPV
jgi:hypothetical protein